jgi:menaquinone-dependent protoporphyrinogen IX oxidase
VVLGGPVYAGTWSKRAAAFARERERELAGKRFAFFSVGMGVEEGIAQAATALPVALVDSALASAKLGGEIRWGRMNFLERLIIKAISHKSGDRSIVDESAVKAFVAQVVEAAKKKSGAD